MQYRLTYHSEFSAERRRYGLEDQRFLAKDIAAVFDNGAADALSRGAFLRKTTRGMAAGSLGKGFTSKGGSAALSASVAMPPAALAPSVSPSPPAPAAVDARDTIAPLPGGHFVIPAGKDAAPGGLPDATLAGTFDTDPLTTSAGAGIITGSHHDVIGAGTGADFLAGMPAR